MRQEVIFMVRSESKIMIVLRRWNDKQNGNRSVITQTPWGGSPFLAP